MRSAGCLLRGRADSHSCLELLALLLLEECVLAPTCRAVLQGWH